MTLPIGFQSHENGINLVQHLGVVELRDPALLAQGILVKDTEIEGLLGVRSAPAPGLKDSVLGASLLVEVVSVETKDFPLV